MRQERENGIDVQIIDGKLRDRTAAALGEELEKQPQRIPVGADRVCTGAAGLDEVASDIIARDMDQLSAAGRRPTRGDVRCMLFGHLTRMAVWNLRNEWRLDRPTGEKLGSLSHAITRLADVECLLDRLAEEDPVPAPAGLLFARAGTRERARAAVAF